MIFTGLEFASDSKIGGLVGQKQLKTFWMSLMDVFLDSDR